MFDRLHSKRPTTSKWPWRSFCRCCHLISHIRFLLVFHCISILHRFRDINNCQKIKTSRDLDHAHLGTVCRHRTTQSRLIDPRISRSVNTGPYSCIWGASNSLAPALVHPTQVVEAFGNISSLLCTLASLLPLRKILRRSSQGNPSTGSVKRKRGIKTERFWTYLINGSPTR